MIETSFEEFKSHAVKFDTIPISTTIVADTKTPIQLFQLFNEHAAFILESKDPISAWSNYSFIGLSPNYFLVEKEKKFRLEGKGGELHFEKDSFQEAWDESLRKLNVAPIWPDFPFPGGAVGYFTFESYSLYETKIPKNNLQETDVNLVFCETILVYDHQKEELSIIHLQNTKSRNVEQSYKEGERCIQQLLSKIQSGAQEESPTILPMNLPSNIDVFEGVNSNYEKNTFLNHVNKLKQYIEAGDVFQGVLSQRFDVPVQSSGLDLYRVLRKVNPSPYLYYLRVGEQEIIGSSPERLIKVDTNRELEIHPIAGTRPRGSTEQEDRALADDLLHDEKEKAEHLMLVDLARNDIGRVSEFSSVKVEEMMTVTHFSHVMHLISKVKGVLSKKSDPFEALFAAHPAGTVSGAPKVRAVEIIRELETDRRGVYAGAIAYCGFNGAIDSCIAIRTILLKDGIASVQAGAGIVYDSIPENEYEETRNKARALLYAIKIAERRFKAEEVLK
ncbi:anthranilate synthase component I [Evansella cellulosilytica]|uniref:Anthranilate synthase component 1 n=1 Tax=Evansella cellulosilytica (strain ATCC 21833 / DSM 2522 / FERM P-1141 / JCM 9156 / N-4) TaxID=649639 RepID=E6TZG4_EVAC2|nr:anthranilate synthase component I [Evansella cellulosilytica]ADU30138.1 anthranilate synthase component I [Evansella cellulosilytica DSM 2522]